MKTLPLCALFLITALVFACTPLGTSSKRYSGTVSGKMEKVGYYLFPLEFYNKETEEKAILIYNDMLSERIEEITGVKPEFIGFINSEAEFLENKKRHDHLDYFFISQLQLIEMLSTGETRRFNATVRTFLMNAETNEPVLETKFGTNLGKSYWRHPVLETAISDAVEGAFKPYAKKKVF